MQTSFLALLGLVASITAMPASLGRIDERQASVCSIGVAQCCSVDVLGIADLDCANPSAVPTNGTDFQELCAAVGQIDMCCILPILDQGIICSTPIGG